MKMVPLERIETYFKRTEEMEKYVSRRIQTASLTQVRKVSSMNVSDAKRDLCKRLENR